MMKKMSVQKVLFVFAVAVSSVSIKAAQYQSVNFTIERTFENGVLGWLYVPEYSDWVVAFKDHRRNKIFYNSPKYLEGGIALDGEPDK